MNTIIIEFCPSSADTPQCMTLASRRRVDPQLYL